MTRTSERGGGHRRTVVTVNPLVEYMRSSTRLDRTATEFLWRDGGSLVTFTAPHNKPVLRDGAYKKRDNNVGVIALEASKLAGANALVPLTSGDDDGNWHDDSRFRTALRSLLPARSVVVDVHGMHDGHGFDAVIGTCGGRAPSWLVSLAERTLVAGGLVTDVRDSGELSAGPNTVTGVLLADGHAAVQIEIARRWRDGRTAPERLTVVIETLARIGVAVRERDGSAP